MAKVEKRGSLNQETLRDFLREMLLIRRFEEKVEDRFRAGELPGFLHVAIGQEAIAAGVGQQWRSGHLRIHHRAHGHMLAHGTAPKEVMAEIYGKTRAAPGAKGGSMHLADIERGNSRRQRRRRRGVPDDDGRRARVKELPASRRRRRVLRRRRDEPGQRSTRR